MLKTTYLRDVPPEVHSVVQPLLDLWAALIAPTWVHEVFVAWNDNDRQEDVAEVQTDVPYHLIRISLGAQFLTQPDDDREKTILHELVHAQLAPISDRGFAILNQLAPGDGHDVPPLLQDAVNDWKDRIESVTCDITLALLNVRRSIAV